MREKSIFCLGGWPVKSSRIGRSGGTLGIRNEEDKNWLLQEISEDCGSAGNPQSQAPRATRLERQTRPYKSISEGYYLGDYIREHTRTC